MTANKLLLLNRRADVWFEQAVFRIIRPRSINWRRILLHFGIRICGDRLRTVQIGPWWMRLGWTGVGGGLSFWAFRRRLIFRPIDYRSIPS